MAVQETNTQGQQTQIGEKISEAIGQQQKSEPARRSNSFSFADLGGIARAPMGRNPSGEILSKLTKALGEAFESMDKNFIATVIPIDRSNTIKLSFSVIVVAVQEVARKERVGFHTLILESSSDPIAPRYENVNGQNVEILKVPSDAYDGVMMDVVLEQLRRAFPKAELFNADTCVVPASFNVEVYDQVYSLAANAVMAAFTELSVSTPGFADVNLANVDRNDAALTAKINFGRDEVYDAVGLPVRADVKIDLLAVQSAGRNDSVNNGIDRFTTVSGVAGFMDLVWDPVVSNTNVYTVNNQNQQFQKYCARFVITQLDPTRLMTIGAQLLALVSAVMLREDNAWVGAFRPKALLGSDHDMHDIGAVGIEANFENNQSGFGIRTNTRSDTFRPEMLGQLVAATIKPGLIMSMDVPECGSQSWYNGVFSSASSSQRANAAIIAAANQLTNGNFRKYFNENARVVIDDMNRIHLGYYTDRQGVKRDIRDVDYLAVANIVGEKDPVVIRDYSDTILRTQYPMAQRLAARKRIITGILTDPVITGFARRITFDAAFIEALINGCRDAGLTIRAAGNYLDNGNIDRSTGNFLNQAVMGGNASGLFNRGYDGFSGNNGMPNQFNRW